MSKQEITMNKTPLFEELSKNIESIIKRDSPLGVSLWQSLIESHPADIAEWLNTIPHDSLKGLFLDLPKQLKSEVFKEFPDGTKIRVLNLMDERDKATALNSLQPDELTDVLDVASDEELKYYLTLLTKHVREQVLSLLKFDPESAGGIMDIEVLTLMQDFTVEKSIKLLQRIRPSRDIYQQIYVTDQEYRLVGYINLEDLVLHSPSERIAEFLRETEYVARANEDQEHVAKQMVHYGLMTVPVVDDQNHFLGAIPSETLVDVLVEEASEDVQKISALPPLKQPYFETSFIHMLYQRGYILVVLLLVESFATTILHAYEETLQIGSLLFFTTMLVSVGGNTSSQTSAVVIQGMASGEILPASIMRFLRRELCIAIFLAIALAITGFLRVWFTTHDVWQSSVISLTLFLIVLVSVSLGSSVPLILRKLNLDPAFSAGPFLATVMDILGVLIFCYVSRIFLG